MDSEKEWSERPEEKYLKEEGRKREKESVSKNFYACQTVSTGSEKRFCRDLPKGEIKRPSHASPKVQKKKSSRGGGTGKFPFRFCSIR